MLKFAGPAALALLAACSNTIVPPASGPRPIARPGAATQPPVRQPVAATPLVPTAAAPAAATVTTAVAAGLLPGPDIATLPITEEAAARALGPFASVVQRRSGAPTRRG